MSQLLSYDCSKALTEIRWGKGYTGLVCMRKDGRIVGIGF